MLKLVVRLHGQVIQTQELSDPSTIYWGGRNENCQIHLNSERGISRQHFKIQLKEGLWNLEITSAYGNIKTGDSSTRELILQEGSSFSISPYEFHVESEHTKSLSLASGEPNLMNRSPNVEGENEKTITRVFNKNKQYIFSYYNKETKERKTYPLTKKEYVIGRDKSCDIVIDDARVSRRQFKITNQSDNFYLIDNKGINPTQLNGNKITSSEPIIINSKDQIKILNHKFIFEIHDSQFETQLEKIKHLALVGHDGINSLNLNPEEGDPTYSSMNPNSLENDPDNIDEIKILNFWGFKIPLTKVNKMRIGLVFILVIIAILSTTDNKSLDDPNNVESQAANPLSKLKPEEQKQVKIQYELAKDLYTKGNYQMAKEELSKVHSKIPSYLDSLELARFIEVGIQSAQEKEQQERLKREAAEAEEKIVNIISFCKQQLKPDAGVSESDECLSPAIQLNPDHELLTKYRGEISRIEEQRKAIEAEKAFKDAQASELDKQYKHAIELSAKDPFKGKLALEEFLKLTMHDPKKLQEKAKKDLKRLERKIKDKIETTINSVKGLVDSGKHKEAIIALERAAEMSPEENSLDDEIERITEDLRKKMQALYQEAILEENIGNIDTAKDRWKKIIDLDIPNGEYYSKAKLKMKKYGG